MILQKQNRSGKRICDRGSDSSGTSYLVIQAIYSLLGKLAQIQSLFPCYFDLTARLYAREYGSIFNNIAYANPIESVHTISN